MKPHQPFQEIVVAPHTPFYPDGRLRLDAVEPQAARLKADGVRAVFIAGTTGEGPSLTLDERRLLTEAWMRVGNALGMRVVVHVGTNSPGDARTLAAHAATSGAAAISTLAPNYFKARDNAALVEWCAAIASAAPDLPFYFYDIPSMTGTYLDMPEFLDRAAEKIPNLAGLKFSNLDLAMFQGCLRAAGGRLDVLFGSDEQLLGAWALGARGAVGSTYNFTTPIALKMLDAWNRGDMELARELQWKIVRWVKALSATGYMASARQVMEWRGVPLGPPRIPHQPLSENAIKQLRATVQSLE